MLRGRDSLGDGALAAGLERWALEGVSFLKDNFPNSDLLFHTSVDVEKRTIILTVIKNVWVAADGRGKPTHMKPVKVFQSEEKAETFITPTTLTKIILVA